MSPEVVEESKVPWQNNLPYEELIKKCPYLAKKSVSNSMLPQSTSSSSLDPNETLTKSKKKRIKKRLKALAAANKPVESSSNENNSPPDLKSHIASSSGSNTKEEAKMSSVPKPTTPTSKTNPKSLPKEPTNDEIDGEILKPNVSVDKSQILAEREARKKSEELAKVTKKSDAILDSKPHSLDSVNIPENVKSITVTPQSINSNKLTNEVESVKKNTEKSRDDILAEREAKKKAKQLAKLKVNVPIENSINKSSEKVLVPQDVVKDATQNVEKIEKPQKSVEESTTKSKAELRAERRAKQEAQRAAKEAEKKSKFEPDKISDAAEKKTLQRKIKIPSKELLEEKEMKTMSKNKSVSHQQRIKLFSHLHLTQKLSQTQISPNMHPSVIKLGAKYASRTITGSNARCVALLGCLKDVISDYVTPAEKEFSRGLEGKLAELTNYLNLCRPLSVSMTNALRHLKSHLSQLPNNVTDNEAKKKLTEVLETFVREQIDVAGEAICETVKKKIANDDVILIYSCSSLLLRILVESARSGRRFTVVVVDGGPWYEGRQMLRRLVQAGLDSTYVHLSAVSFIMRQVSKVLLGAHALLANGCVMSRSGAALVALAARSYNVPVLVCCETYKFCERVQTDAFVYNELGSPEEVVSGDDHLTGWSSLSYLSPLSLLYDITPPDLVTAVVTELAILPCTSVPVILRVKPSDLVL